MILIRMMVLVPVIIMIIIFIIYIATVGSSLYKYSNDNKYNLNYGCSYSHRIRCNSMTLDHWILIELDNSSFS